MAHKAAIINTVDYLLIKWTTTCWADHRSNSSSSSLLLLLGNQIKSRGWSRFCHSHRLRVLDSERDGQWVVVVGGVKGVKPIGGQINVTGNENTN